jgi:hypothetical protein
VITTLSGQPFLTRTQFEQAIAGLPAGEATLQVRRGDQPRELVVDVPTLVRPVPHISARPVTPSNVRVDIPPADRSKKRAATGVTVPNSDELKTNQPLDAARPNIQGGEREPRANR